MKFLQVAVLLVSFSISVFSAQPLLHAVDELSRLEGEPYRAMRDTLVAHGDDLLADLQAIYEDKEQRWPIRLQAGILIEHIEQPGEFRRLVQQDWFSDPDFDPRWHMNRAGPGPMATGLILRRYVERGLWFSYFEQFWKGVEEENTDLRLRPGTWESLALGALRTGAPPEVRTLLIQWAIDLVHQYPHLDAPLAGSADGLLVHFNTPETRRARLERLRRVGHEIDHDTLQTLLLNLIWHTEDADEANAFEQVVNELRGKSTYEWHLMGTFERSIQNVREGRPAKEDYRLQRQGENETAQ